MTDALVTDAEGLDRSADAARRAGQPIPAGFLSGSDDVVAAMITDAAATPRSSH